MIETAESRAEFEARKSRAVAAMKATWKGELPLDSHVTIATKEIKKRAESEAELAKAEGPKKRDRAAYMRDFRRRPKFCPHCHKQL